MRKQNLAQSLAVESQIRLPGSAGRLIHQIRDVMKVAPLFKELGLVKSVERPKVIDLHVAGIATHSCIKGTFGGYIFASGAVCTEMNIEQNQVSSGGSDSLSELDDIDFEAQRKRLDLIEIRQAYQLVERQLKQGSKAKLILVDTPLFLDRAMAPLDRNIKHGEEYQKTKACISDFWRQYREHLFPWNPHGPVLASIVAERFSAIVSIAKQDLRNTDGHSYLLCSDKLDDANLNKLQDLESSLRGIGDKRFIHGILSAFSRTIAFRLSDSSLRMEPAESVAAGVVGFHYRGGQSSQIQMVQLAGEEQDWDTAKLDAVAWKLMALDIHGQSKTKPLPQLLAMHQLKMLDQFANYYRQGLSDAIKNNEVEDTWLSGLDEDL
ncbi:conserved hypothetical protein [Vibrio chagasii]|nr:conserved hypothetical protein [Vibrio chagasii]CAH6849349.1 conserved hypothetical protein [Vibrio chagasii]CAH6854227.1 conserved hypothetical protein [Vibrio chagasii]CAH7055265.1 conserved hypothetical protein [Vibrio chagasii]CAH7096144.1 conserved hypothetical protein [Vibrio chagasii]